MQGWNLFPTKPECCGLYYFMCSFSLLKEQKCLGPGKNINIKAASFKFGLTGVHKCNQMKFILRLFSQNIHVLEHKEKTA